jgi:diphthine synthase
MEGPQLFFIGLGLGGLDDITVRGLEAVKSCELIFLEAYTSVLPGVSKELLEAHYGGKDITVADRELVEQAAERILEPARDKRVAFLVVGDPFGATTHSDLHWRAMEMGIKVTVIHNASIMNAAACCGLQLYRFGQTVSITFMEGSVLPRSTYDKIAVNQRVGTLHTLCLLDIKVKEQTVENMLKGNKVFEPPRFMSCAQAATLLLRMEEEFGQGVCGPDTRCIGLARVGHASQVVRSATLGEMAELDLGEPLHTLVLAGELHPEEEHWFNHYASFSQQ